MSEQGDPSGTPTPKCGTCAGADWQRALCPECGRDTPTGRTPADEECVKCIACRVCVGACDCTGGPQTEPECTCYELTGGHQPGCYFNRPRKPSAPTPGGTTGGDARSRAEEILRDFKAWYRRTGGQGAEWFPLTARIVAAVDAETERLRADLAAALKREGGIREVEQASRAHCAVLAAERDAALKREEGLRDTADVYSAKLGDALKREGEARAETAETAETARALADALIDEDKALRERDTAQRAARKARERATRLERIIYDSDGILEARNLIEALAPVPTAEAEEPT